MGSIILVYQYLRNLGNFNGMLTIVGALESPSITRLTHTSSELKRKRRCVQER